MIIIVAVVIVAVAVDECKSVYAFPGVTFSP